MLTYRLGILIYNATVSFCKHYILPKDRTFDQMVQAARSDVANIIERSEAAATSKKMELKLTNIAKNIFYLLGLFCEGLFLIFFIAMKRKQENIAPIKQFSISACVSQGSPCVPI